MPTSNPAFLFTLLVLSLSACNSAENQTPITAPIEEKPQIDPSNVDLPVAEIDDVYFIIAPNGLNLRKTGDPKSPIKLTIKYAEEVTPLEEPKGEILQVDDKSGQMIRVDYMGTKGYIFNGYLSTEEPEPQNFYWLSADKIAREDVSIHFIPKKLIGTGDGDAPTEGINWSFEFEGKQIADKVYSVTVTSFPENDETMAETSEEKWTFSKNGLTRKMKGRTKNFMVVE